MRQGILYWITGLSGSGKTTIGVKLYDELKKYRDNVVFLDGDILKGIMADDLVYTNEERKKRGLKYTMLCKALVDQGMIVICCTIAMFHEIQDWNRKNNKMYVEVFLDVDMDTLRKRDKKGLYSGIEKGELKNVVGVDIKAEFPQNPDIILCNDGRYTVEECVKKIMDFKIKENEK